MVVARVRPRSGCGSDGDVDDQPGRPVFVDQAGDQAGPGLGKMTRTHPATCRTWRVQAGPGTSWHELAGLAGWRAAGGHHGRDGHEEEEAPGGQAFFPLLAKVEFEIGRTRQREVWPLTSMTSNYSPSRGHPESPHTK